LEIGQGQGEMVTSLIKSYFPQASVELISDLGGIERVVKVMLWEGDDGRDRTISSAYHRV